MYFKKLNLSFFSTISLLLLLIYGQQAAGQPSTVSVVFKNGKAERSPSNLPVNFLPQSISSGNQRTFIINAIITLTVTTIQPSCGYSNGAVIVSASGGTAPYTYTIDQYYFLNSGNFPNLVAGNYTVLVTDAIGQTATASVVLTNTLPPPLLTVTSLTRPSACDGTDGVVTLTASGGVPPYQYSMDLVNFQSSGTFSNLGYGLYGFFVRDANGCIAAFNGFDILHLFWPIGCNGGTGYSYTPSECYNDAQITANGGSQYAPFTYSLDGINYQASGTFSNLGYGIYNVYFKNVLGHVEIFAVNIVHNCFINLDYISVDAACQQNDGTLTVTATNGIAPYTFTLDGINYQTSNVFANLAPGNYYITVRDGGGFTSSRSATVYDRCPAVTLSATGETCLQNDGTITATATKGTAPYQYSIDGINFQNSNLFTSLDTGPYTITLRDALGFTSTATIAVPNSCLSVFAAVVNSTCGNNSGSINASASNGTAPYQYSADGINFQASNIFTGLAAGPYTITAKDINGKTGNINVSVFNIAGPQIVAASTPAFCSDNNGVITISGIGGTLPFQFSMDGTNYQSSNIFNAIASGAYTAWIKDLNGCLASQPVTVLLNCPTVTATVVNETCSSSNGTVIATAAGGTAPYQYSIDGINFQNGNAFAGLAAGSYTITVKDALGAINTVSATVSNICPTVTVIAINGLCGTANASIAATGANGTQPYQYSIDGINFQANNNFTGLVSATYTVTIRDANGLTNTTSTVVQNFPGPQITVTNTPASCLNNDGSINITAIGGTSPFQYSINGINFQNGNVFSNAAGGNYTAAIKDANGCTGSQPVSIALADNLTLSTGNSTPVCEGKTVLLTAASNGSGFTWSPSASLNDSHVLNPQASPGTTTKYYITSTLGVCTKLDSVLVIVNAAPIPFAGKDSTICYGQGIQLTGSGGLNYEWTPATYLDDAHIANPTFLNPHSSITYYLKVTNGNGCESLQSSPVTITVTPMQKVFAGNDTSIVMNQSFQLNAKDVNNSGFTHYTWSPPYGLNNNLIKSPVTSLDRDMIYSVTAVTDKGCTGTDEISIKVYKGPEIYVPTGFTPNNDGRNDILKAIPVGIKEFRYFAIYNRWGERVFYSSAEAKGWDGKMNGVQPDTGIFVWMAEGIDEKGNVIRRKGTVTLIR